MKTPLDLRARGLVPALVLLLSLTATLSLRAQDTTEVPVDVKVDVEVRPDVYVVVEEMPTLLPNNEVGMENLQASVRYPEMARRAGIEGRVIVQFVVDETGGVQNPEIVRGVGAGLDEEALRAVRTLTFTPGRQRGEAVKVQMTLPVTFRLGTGQPLHDNSSQGEANTLQLKDVRRDGNRLTGQVVSNSNAPVPKASLQIVGTQIGAATNDEGRFTLIGLPTGSFELRISAEGFEPLVTFGQEGDLSPETMSSTTPLPRTTTSLTTPLPRTTLTPMGMMAIPRTMTASEAKELAQATLPQTHPDIGNHIIIFELLDEGKPEVLVSHCPQYNTAAIAEARAMMTRSTQLPQTRTMISVLACPNE